MAEESRESLEAVRVEKLRRIAALGVDPWGQRFDGAMPIAQIRAQPAESFDTNPTTRARAAGRIVLRRIMGKVHFLQLRDQTGDDAGRRDESADD